MSACGVSVGVCPGGICLGVSVSSQGGGCLLPVHAGIHTPPVNRITDACENGKNGNVVRTLI